MRGDLVTNVYGDLADPGQAAELSGDELLQSLMLALRRVGQLQVDDDIRAIEMNLPHRLRRNEIAAGVRIRQSVQTGLDVSLGNGHRNFLGKGRFVEDGRNTEV